MTGHPVYAQNEAVSNFEAIANIDGAGNSSQIVFYEYKDNQPLVGFSFYRIAQQDIGGEITRSSIKSVFREENQVFSFKIYPNPPGTNQALRLGYSLPKGAHYVTVNVFNEQGKRLLNKKGEFIKSIDISTLSSGVYFIRLGINHKQYLTKRLIIK